MIQPITGQSMLPGNSDNASLQFDLAIDGSGSLREGLLSSFHALLEQVNRQRSLEKTTSLTAHPVRWLEQVCNDSQRGLPRGLLAHPQSDTLTWEDSVWLPSRPRKAISVELTIIIGGRGEPSLDLEEEIGLDD